MFYPLTDASALGVADGLHEDSGRLINLVHAHALYFKRVDYNCERVQDDGHRR